MRFCGTSSVRHDRSRASRSRAHFAHFAYLAGHGRIPAARQLLTSLPRELVQQAHTMKAEGREHIYFQKFFGVWDAFAKVGEVKNQEPTDRVKKVEIADWKDAYAVS